MSGFIDIILGRPLVDHVDNARQPVVFFGGVGDLGLAVGVYAAEHDGLTTIVRRVAPRPICVLNHGVVADSQTGDGRAHVALEHHGGHEIVALHDVEHERLVRVRALTGNVLGDLQAAGVDMAQERLAFRQSAGLAVAERVMEFGMFRHIGVAQTQPRRSPSGC